MDDILKFIPAIMDNESLKAVYDDIHYMTVKGVKNESSPNKVQTEQAQISWIIRNCCLDT